MAVCKDDFIRAEVLVVKLLLPTSKEEAILPSDVVYMKQDRSIGLEKRLVPAISVLLRHLGALLAAELQSPTELCAYFLCPHLDHMEHEGHRDTPNAICAEQISCTVAPSVDIQRSLSKGPEFLHEVKLVVSEPKHCMPDVGCKEVATLPPSSTSITLSSDEPFCEK
ncbi:hypothetical protein NQZ68_012107 [Dissostichus eleginoides]|nr:hypothetical protein NQZ68_012107 [Dissostichus eleginoides]